MKTLASLALCALLAPTTLSAQSPYAGLEQRRLKALSDDQIAAYQAGDGMGLALAAELNGYPGPKHVLELATELELSAEQQQATREVFDGMHREAQDLGAEILALEESLDQAFAAGAISEDSLATTVGEIAERTGRLRATHLAAHLQMMAILEPGQIERYQALRGYGEESHPHHHAGHHHGTPSP